MDKGQLLDRVRATGDDRMLLANVLDRAEQARNRNIPTATDFLSPQQQVLAEELLKAAGTAPTDYVLLGGYEGAERKLLLFLPDWLEAEDAMSQCPIRVLRAGFREEYKLTHRDFLGSLMGMGIVRETVGDILVGSNSADLIVLEGITDFLLSSWDTAGRARLNIKEIPPDYIHIPEVQCKEIRSTVSSLRLDAVVSDGFQMGRGKAADLISAGRVQVNWKEATKPDRSVSAGDTISARGFGKLELTEVGGTTKKGRISITMKRYI